MPLVHLRDSIPDPLLSSLYGTTRVVFRFGFNFVHHELEVESKAATFLCALQVDICWVELDLVYLVDSFYESGLALVNEEASVHLFNLVHERTLQFFERLVQLVLFLQLPYELLNLRNLEASLVEGILLQYR